MEALSEVLKRYVATTIRTIISPEFWSYIVGAVFVLFSRKN